MRKVSGIACLYFMQVLLFTGFAHASVVTPEAVVRQAADEMYRALQQECPPAYQNPQRLFLLVDQILLPHADFSRMSRLVIGKHWKQANDEQRQQLMREFRMLLVRTYATAIQDLSPKNIHYLPARDSNKPDQAVVRTEVRQPGQPVLPIDYHMYKKDGRWLVYDVRIEGISLVTNYRNIFSAEIRAKGMQGLIEGLEQQNRRQVLKAAGNAQAGRAGTC